MNMWGSMGQYLDGWAKFAVAIAAIGWFGLEVADRYAPRSATVTIGQPEAVEQTVRANTVSLRTATAGADVPVFEELVQEFATAIRLLAANTFAQLAAVLAVGVTGGLALRPKMNRWKDSRAVRSARKRADRHAADLRLLAAHDAKSNVSGPSHAGIQPLKRH